MFLYSNKFSGIDFSISEIFDISQTVSRDFQVLSAPGASAPAPSGFDLNQSELLSISQAISRDYAPCLQSQLSGPSCNLALAPVELRDICTSLAIHYAPYVVTDHDNLVLMPLDAENIYVYWQLADNGVAARTLLDQPVRLKITAKEPLTTVDIIVTANQGGQKIATPLQRYPVSYRAGLGRSVDGDRFCTLIESNPLTTTTNRRVPISENGATLIPRQIANAAQQSGPLAHPLNKTASGQNSCSR